MQKFIPIQLPENVSVDNDSLSSTFGRFTISPIEPGFGITIANTIRRVLLSSMVGSAVRFVRIEGLHHEFSPIPGSDTDFVDLILRLKKLVIKMTNLEEVSASLQFTGKGEITASDITLPTGVEIINKDLSLLEFTQEVDFKMDIWIGTGRGYVPSEEQDKKDKPLGAIAVDSIYSPVVNVSYKKESERVGKRIDFDKIIMDITTNGSIDPKFTFFMSAKLLRDFYDKMVLFEKEPDYVEELKMDTELEQLDELINTNVQELELSVRSSNCLLTAKIDTIKDLVSKTEAEMLRYRNFGRKSLNEIKEILARYDLHLGMDVGKIETRIEEAKSLLNKGIS